MSKYYRWFKAEFIVFNYSGNVTQQKQALGDKSNIPTPLADFLLISENEFKKINKTKENNNLPMG